MSTLFSDGAESGINTVSWGVGTATQYGTAVSSPVHTGSFAFSVQHSSTLSQNLIHTQTLPASRILSLQAWLYAPALSGTDPELAGGALKPGPALNISNGTTRIATAQLIAQQAGGSGGPITYSIEFNGNPTTISANTWYLVTLVADYSATGSLTVYGYLGTVLEMGTTSSASAPGSLFCGLVTITAGITTSKTWQLFGDDVVITDTHLAPQNYTKTLTVSSASALSLATPLIRAQTLTAASASHSTLLTNRVYRKTLSLSSLSSASLAEALTRVQTLSAASPVTSTLSISLSHTLSVRSPALPSLSHHSAFIRTSTIPVRTTPAFTATQQLQRTLSTSVSSTAAIAQLTRVIQQLLAATTGGAVTLTPAITRLLTLLAQSPASGSVLRQKHLHLALAATAHTIATTVLTRTLSLSEMLGIIDAIPPPHAGSAAARSLRVGAGNRRLRVVGTSLDESTTPTVTTVSLLPPAPVQFYAGDTRPTLELGVIYDDASGPVDLSDATITITIAPFGAHGTVLPGVPATILDAANGLVEFKLPVPLTLPPGLDHGVYFLQLEVDFGSGDLVTTERLQLNVSARLSPE